MNERHDDLGAGVLGSFSWDVGADLWTWSDEMFALHGYAPGEVEPSYDLVLRHKTRDGRQRAERVMSRADSPGFRFSNRHRILDRTGRSRVVVALGEATREPTPGGDVRQVVRGYLVDVTPAQEAPMTAPRIVPAGGHVLSGREHDVVALIAAGRTNEEIAAELFVSINTVKTYVRTAYRKIGAARRSQAVAWAHAHGVLPVEVSPRP